MSYSVRIIEFLFYLLPISLITGPLIPEIEIIFIIICSLILTNKIIKINFLIKLLIALNILIAFESLFIYQKYDFENLKFIFFFRFILFAIIISYIFSLKKKIFKNLIILLVIILITLFLDSILQFSSGKNIFGLVPENHYRVSSFFGDEYILGSYVGRMMPILISSVYFFINKKRTDKIVLFILILGFFLCLISGDRSSLIFPIVLLLIFCLIDFHQKKITLFVFSIFCLGIIFTSSTINQRYINQSLDGLFYNNKLIYISPSHHNYAVVSLNMFKEKKFFGHGFKSFRKLCEKERFHDKTIEIEPKCSTHSHNYYLQFLSENGLFNFAILLIIFIYVTIKLIKLINDNFSKNLKRSNSLIFAYAGVFISLFPLIPSGSFFNGWLLIIFFMYISLINFFESYQK
tara:strand:- start:375 stop:1589 length:1215 start_codon:yes stop_codon:yes gene_type:complete